MNAINMLHETLLKVYTQVNQTKAALEQNHSPQGQSAALGMNTLQMDSIMDVSNDLQTKCKDITVGELGEETKDDSNQQIGRASPSMISPSPNSGL